MLNLRTIFTTPSEMTRIGVPMGDRWSSPEWKFPLGLPLYKRFTPKGEVEATGHRNFEGSVQYRVGLTVFRSAASVSISPGAGFNVCSEGLSWMFCDWKWASRTRKGRLSPRHCRRHPQFQAGAGPDG